MAAHESTYIILSKAIGGMDLITVDGLACGFAMTCIAIFLRDSLDDFIDPKSIFIVMGSAPTSDKETHVGLKCC